MHPTEPYIRETDEAANKALNLIQPGFLQQPISLFSSQHNADLFSSQHKTQCRPLFITAQTVHMARPHVLCSEHKKNRPLVLKESRPLQVSFFILREASVAPVASLYERHDDEDGYSRGQ